MKKNISTKEIQKSISLNRDSDIKWTRDLWFLVENKYNKFYSKLESLPLPSHLTKDLLLLQFHALIFKTIITSGMKDNSYLIFPSPMQSSDSNNRTNKVRLKKEITEDLIDNFLFLSEAILLQKDLSLKLNEVNKRSIQADKFLGKKRKEENILIYKEVLKIRDELKEKHLSGQLTGTNHAAEVYLTRNHIVVTNRKVKTLAQNVTNYEKSFK